MFWNDQHDLKVTRASRSQAAGWLGWLLIPAILPASLIGLWALAIDLGYWPTSLIASPLDVARAFARLLLDGTLIQHAAVSLMRLITGFLIGFVPALFVGGIVGTSRLAERCVMPTIQVFSPVPVIAWIPLLIILFGIAGARIAIVAVGTFFGIVFATVSAFRSVDLRLFEVARVLEKRPLEMFWGLFFPATLASIIDALRMSLAIAWILLLAGEVIASSSGLGWLIWNSRNFARPDEMIVGMIAVGILGALTDHLVAQLQARWLHWRKSYSGQQLA